LLSSAAAIIAGCDKGRWPPQTKLRPAEQPEGSVKVPHPIDLLLPKSIRIHSFTGTRTFDEAGGVKGIDVRVELKDAYGEANKAFGTFRFELYEFRPNNPDPKGRLITTWEENLLEPERNVLHWNIHRTYEFKLVWEHPIPVGRKFVLRVIFSSPFTKRLFDERVFISGQ